MPVLVFGVFKISPFILLLQTIRNCIVLSQGEFEAENHEITIGYNRSKQGRRDCEFFCEFNGIKRNQFED